MESVTKQDLKDWITAGNNKAYKTLVVYYGKWFKNIGIKAAVKEIEKDLGIQINYDAAYYAYRVIYGKKKKNNHAINSIASRDHIKAEEPMFKDASELEGSKAKFKF